LSSGTGRPSIIYALVGAVALGLLYLAYSLGQFRSGFSLLDHRREVAALTQRLEEEQSTSDELRRQLAIAQTSGEIDRETYSRVESNLSDLQAKIQAQEEELVFYRGIVSPQDGVAGLRIQSLDVLPGDGERRYTLRLVLVQAIVHSQRVSGDVKLQLEGARNGQTATFDVADLAVGDGRYDMSYEFRYFQGLETELTLPVGFEPQRVNVEIVPSQARADHVSQSFEWSVAATG
jgi:Family of unknown function (DUF6776)